MGLDEALAGCVTCPGSSSPAMRAATVIKRSVMLQLLLSISVFTVVGHVINVLALFDLKKPHTNKKTPKRRLISFLRAFFLLCYVPVILCSTLNFQNVSKAWALPLVF